MVTTYTKIDKDNFKRTMKVDREDNFNLPNLNEKKKKIEDKITPLQEQLDEINDIILEISKVDN